MRPLRAAAICFLTFRVKRGPHISDNHLHLLPNPVRSLCFPKMDISRRSRARAEVFFQLEHTGDWAGFHRIMASIISNRSYSNSRLVEQHREKCDLFDLKTHSLSHVLTVLVCFRSRISTLPVMYSDSSPLRPT